MGSGNNAGLIVESVRRSGGRTLQIDLATGPAAGFAGLRRAIRTLRDAQADFGTLPVRYPAEWAVLSGEPDAMTGLAAIALSASERRLHRESEQAFRVLALAAGALCRASESLDMTLLLRGAGRTDLPSLKGLVRAAEYSAATGRGRLSVEPGEALVTEPLRADAVDCREERARALRLLGLDVSPGRLRTGAPVPVTGQGRDAELFATALDPQSSAPERIAAALDYCRLSFYTGNWEGMGVVASGCLGAAAGLTRADVARLAAQASAGSGEDNQAIEFEAALLRYPDDVRAFLLKVLGIQAAFRGRQDDAVRFFRGMRDTDGPLSAETLAQSHLYAALTLTKRQHRVSEAVAELEAGFAAVAEEPGEPVTRRRERGWLHNLRGLTLFAGRDLVAALDHEKAALDCIDGLTDASSLHLRVNLVSNISVLQESAGKQRQALETWQRFADSAFRSDAKFAKHHAYRAGGLRIALGDTAAGVADLDASLRHGERLADDFHACEIAVELGTLLLADGDRNTAADYYDEGAAAAARLGDPYRMALAELGRRAATGLPPTAGTAILAANSLTRPDRVRALAQGCRDGADPLTLLPLPRTKLNRPFDLVAD